MKRVVQRLLKQGLLLLLHDHSLTSMVGMNKFCELNNNTSGKGESIAREKNNQSLKNIIYIGVLISRYNTQGCVDTCYK